MDDRNKDSLSENRKISSRMKSDKIQASPETHKQIAHTSLGDLLGSHMFSLVICSPRPEGFPDLHQLATLT